MKFKVGDRVRAIDCVDGRKLAGQTGTVIDISGCFGDYDIGVEFDNLVPIWGHSCDGKGNVGHCRWGYEREFELISSPHACNKKIVITSDGKETLARLFEENKCVKSATAKCAPEDTFDFETGAKIAIKRLIGEESKWRVVNRSPKAGDYIRIVQPTFGFVKAGDILRVHMSFGNGVSVLASDHPRETGQNGAYEWFYCQWEFEVVEPIEKETKEEPKEKFVPHLYGNRSGNKGVIGDNTPIKDAIGRPLCVGDTVELFSKFLVLVGERAVVCDPDKGEAFVMGIRGCVDYATGDITDGFKIIKKRSYKDIPHGEVVGDIKYIKEP